MTDSLRVFVSGMIAGDPYQGGATRAVLQYVLGLRGLGHDVYLVEPIAPGPLRPATMPLSESTNANYFHALTERFGLGGRAALLLQDTSETVGVPYGRLIEAARSSDLLINISGMLTDPILLEALPRRIESRCGWFRDRSVCYLASGRPVVAQHTGFSHLLPSAAG
jgi:hypothetical protein